jgi:hypothetical protein
MRRWAPEDGAGDVAFVAAEVVQDDDIARRDARGENLLDVEEEGFAVDRPIDHPGRINPVVAQRGDEGQGFPMAVGRAGLKPSLSRPPAAQGRHVRLHPEPAPAKAGVSSMNTSREGAIRPRWVFHRARFRATSGRLCSSASSVSFEAQALGVNEHPHRPADAS